MESKESIGAGDGQAVLHGVSLSPFVRKVRAALAVKEIPYRLIAVMPGAMDAEFRALSPMAKIPVWQEGDFALPDSSAICAYLDRRQPAPPILPAHPQAYGRALFWEEFGDTRLAEAAGPPFFQRIVRARVFHEEPDEEIVERHLEEVLPPVQDQLESLFIASGIADPEAPTVAELAIWSSFVNLEHAGLPVDAGRWPRLAEFIAAMDAHPKLSPLLDEEREFLPSR